jgi:hypothetical protein
MPKPHTRSDASLGEPDRQIGLTDFDQVRLAATACPPKPGDGGSALAKAEWATE